MLPFDDMIGRLKKLKNDAGKILMVELEKNHYFFIINLVTDDQLYNRGVDNQGNKIFPGYAKSTIAKKKKVGLPFDRVTLLQDGDFYNHMFLEFDDYFFTVGNDDPDTSKLTYLYNRYGVQVLGLTNDNVLLVAHRSKDGFVKRIKKHFLNE